MKTIFTTWCTDDYKEKYSISKLENSLKYFHSDIPFDVVDTSKTQDLLNKNGWAKYYHMSAVKMIEYFNQYNRVVHIDADSIVTGRLDDVFDNTFDLCCVRNYTLAGWAANTPAEYCIIPMNLNRNQYMNAGFISCTNKQFAEYWLETCCRENYLDEQDILNKILTENKFTSKILDDFESGVSYGLTNVWGHQTHWDSWKCLYVKNHKLYQINQLNQEVEVKILHMAGGSGPKNSIFNGKNMFEWLIEWVNPDVREYLLNITK
jgi:hypothetical protein